MLRTQSEAAASWSKLETHLNEIYHQPDLEALAIVCSAIASHDLLSAPPVWPIVIGPPSTGKTEICVVPFGYHPHFQPIGDISPKSFLPGRGPKSGSLLRDSGPSSVWLCKDLGTLLSKREADAKEVFGILRDVYDGEVARRVGGVKIPVWHGKVTFVAASTPFLDRAYDFIGELGDRFVFVRWRRGSGMEQGRKALRHSKFASSIQADNRALVENFMHHGLSKAPADLPEELEEKVLYLAEATARLRTRVVRNSKSSTHEIIEVPEAEGPARILKNMLALATFHAALMGREQATSDDLRLARRIAFDSIPGNRARFIQAMRIGADTTWVEVRQHSNLPPSTIAWIADELQYMNILERYEGADVSYKFTREFEKIWGIANLPIVKS